MRRLWYRFLWLGFGGWLLAVTAAGAQTGREADLPLVRLGILELQVQGGRPAAEFRPVVESLLPAILDCLASGRRQDSPLPERLALRFNVDAGGRLIWFKLLSPGRTDLEAPLKKVLQQPRWPAAPQPAKVYLVLGLKTDHLLSN